MTDESIYIENLSIGYPSKNETHLVAQHVNATLYSGELTCLLGANGVGKSTLLRTLSAFQPKICGDINILGKNIDEYKKNELSNVISVVLTDKCDVYNMTVFEMVSLGRSPYTGFWGKLADADMDIVRKSIRMVKIDDLSDRMIHTLSDGERQKVMIAKALAQDTDIIFLDEPTAFLDFPSKVDLMQLLHRLSRETNKTIFLSTHDLEIALQIADKLWIMNRNMNVSIGTPEDLSLKGVLAEHFASDGLFFEPNTGSFKVKHECHSKIKLLGEGVEYAMARKALLRNGISAGNDVDTLSYIEVHTSNNIEIFCVCISGQPPYTCNNCEEMLRYLRSYY